MPERAMPQLWVAKSTKGGAGALRTAESTKGGAGALRTAESTRDGALVAPPITEKV